MLLSVIENQKEVRRMKFEIGKIYEARSACDYDCIFSFEVIARTARQITIKVRGEAVNRGVSMYEGSEVCFPLGKYSMCPIIRANSPKA